MSSAALCVSYLAFYFSPLEPCLDRCLLEILSVEKGTEWNCKGALANMMLGYVRSKGKQKPLLSMQPIPFFLCLFFLLKIMLNILVQQLQMWVLSSYYQDDD